MARLSQKQLDDIAKNRKIENDTNKAYQQSVLDIKNNKKEDRMEINPKMINDILNDSGEPPYKYKLPKISRNGNTIPLVNADEFPKLNIKGQFSADRQNKCANLYLLKEIDHLLEHINEGKNKNATLNFLIWVGLQTLKGINGTIDIRVHDSTYADGQIIFDYLEKS